MRYFRNILLLLALIVATRSELVFAEVQSTSLPIITFEVGPFAKWKPTPEQIREAEVALRLAFDKATKELGTNPFQPKELSSYGRQYFGKVKDNRQFIEVIGFCDAHGQNQLELSKTPLLVLDGGICYFRGEYYLDKKVFESFYFHGEA